MSSAKGGRPRKPTALKVVEGTQRKDRAVNEATPDRVDARPPESLKGEAQRMKYSELAERLAPVGLLTVADQESLAVLARLEVMAEQLEEKITLDFERGSTGQPIADPRLQALMQLHKQTADIRKEFGMTPSSRAGIALPKKEAADPMEGYLERVK